MNKSIEVDGEITDTLTQHTIEQASPALNTIIFHHQESGDEMLKIAREGFYVRGEKIPQDAEEARKVYDTFTEWLRTTGLSV